MARTTDTRVEAVARAMARFRLAHHHRVASGLTGRLADSIRRVEDKLWPSLVDEAEAVIAALDPPSGSSPSEPQRLTAAPSARPGESAAGDQKT
jgi:hypothetical protein